MKSMIFMTGLCFLLSLNTFGQVYEKLNESEVVPEKVQLAQKFAVAYLTAQKNGSFYRFNDEAIDILKNQLTEDIQKAGYKKIKDTFGDFVSLEYAETWIQKGNTAYKIYRFKGDFDKSSSKLGIRVILNAADKVAGFWIKPWADKLM